MIFDPTFRPDHSGLPAPVRKKALATFLRNRELGCNVQFIDPDTGELQEWSFNSEERRDGFISKLDRQKVDCITSDCPAYGRTPVDPEFTTPVDAETAEKFLAELADAELMYHPEDEAADCLSGQNIREEVIERIQINMNLSFQFLDDPCEIALRELDRVRAEQN
jgi:hypothetical protein